MLEMNASLKLTLSKTFKFKLHKNTVSEIQANKKSF